MFSARPWARCSPSAWMTLATPAIWLAALAAPPALWPATRTWTSPPHWAAAVTVLRVAPLMEALSCSATTRAVMSSSLFGCARSNHLGFVLQLGHQRGHVGHLDAGRALRGLQHLQCLQVRLDLHAQVGRLEGLELLLLGLHDVGQRHVARLVQAQIGRDDGRQAHRNGLHAAVHFTRD